MKNIYPPHPEWNTVNFKLQLAISNPAIEILNIVKYSSEFDPAYRYHLKLDAFIDATTFNEQNM